MSKSTAAKYARDGAWVEWTRMGELFLVTPGGDRTRLTGFEGLSTGVMLVSDELVLLQADGRQPLLCIDRQTGKPTGRLEEMKGEPYDAKTTLYNSVVFDPRDGRSAWLTDGGRLAQYDLATRRPLEVLEPKAGESFAGLAVHPDGWVLTSVSKDELVLLSVQRGEVARKKLRWMSAAPLRDGFVVFDPDGKRFVFLDFELQETGTLAHDRKWALLVAMPSLREWITIGGHGEWDHCGEDDLTAPVLSEPTKPAKKPAAKKAKPKAK